MKKKLIVFDIDGTILNKKKEVNLSTINAIKKAKEKGHIVILATGRTIGESVNKLINDLSLDQFVIFVNGNFIYDIKSKKIESNGNELDFNIRQKFIEIAKKYRRQLIAYNINGDLRRYYFGDNQLKDIQDEDYFNNGVEVLEFDDIDELDSFIFNESLPIVHLGFKAEKDIINKAINEFDYIKQNELAHISIVGKVFIDADSNGINKYFAINKVAKLLDINNEDIIAFGDSYNDLEMLKNVGKGFLMGNAIESLKNQFNETNIIGDNNSDAIFETLVKELELEI